MLNEKNNKTRKSRTGWGGREELGLYYDIGWYTMGWNDAGVSKFVFITDCNFCSYSVYYSLIL